MLENYCEILVKTIFPHWYFHYYMYCATLTTTSFYLLVFASNWQLLLAICTCFLSVVVKLSYFVRTHFHHPPEEHHESCQLSFRCFFTLVLSHTQGLCFPTIIKQITLNALHVSYIFFFFCIIIPEFNLLLQHPPRRIYFLISCEHHTHHNSVGKWRKS